MFDSLLYSNFAQVWKLEFSFIKHTYTVLPFKVMWLFFLEELYKTCS